MNTILLQPTDVLFFRDGRPMSGSLAGHTAAWPLPDVTSHALHAALHRAGLDGVHAHRRGRSGYYTNERDRKFGSLITAGPFPVDGGNRWFFPRPKDAQLDHSVEVTLHPVASRTDLETPWLASGLPGPLQYAVANRKPPGKDSGGEPWISRDAFNAYLKGDAFKPAQPAGHFLGDDDLADREQQIGITIDPETQATGQGSAAGKIYSAHYLRLREGFRLGVLASSNDKEFKPHGGDLIKALLDDHPARIVVGGQQRLCTAERVDVPKDAFPLPCGLSGAASFHRLANGAFAVKWVLLSPAIWPEIPAKKKDGSDQSPHPGGWLPNWVFLGWDPVTRTPREDDRNGRVLLTSGPGTRKAERKGVHGGAQISARLVAALVPKPLVVTGWALANGVDSERDAGGGAKSTHLAVPAGAVYYFEADSSEAAAALANALNWHGGSAGTEIKNRRSTLLGEKGYGLGVCGTWKPFGDVP